MVLEPILITAKVTTVLEDFKGPYLIGSSLASTVHGLVRTAQDVEPKIEAMVATAEDTLRFS